MATTSNSVLDRTGNVLRAFSKTLGRTFTEQARRTLADSEIGKAAEAKLTAAALRGVFYAMDARMRIDASYRSLMYRPATSSAPDDWRATMQFEARDGSLCFHVTFGGGRARCRGGVAKAADATMSFRDANAARTLITKSPADVLDMLLLGDLIFHGNMSHVARLSYMLSALVDRNEGPEVALRTPFTRPTPKRSLPMQRCDAAEVLDDPALSAYTLDDFPRLAGFLEDYFSTTPHMCTERPRLYTEYMRKNGFETHSSMHPALRQAGAFHHLMAHRRPIVRERDLLAGTSTTKDIGIIVYPECGGIPIWPELRTMSRRALNPYRITPEDERILNEVLPFWASRNVREWARAVHDDPLCLHLDERFVLYFQWKTQAVSHTIPGFPVVLEKGLAVLREEALAAAEAAQQTTSLNGTRTRTRTFYEAMAQTLDGVMDYANNLAKETRRLAALTTDPTRRAELDELARVCAKVPARPAETLHEALQAMWTVWIACHMENTNAGLSIGRIDQWLQPFFLADVAKLPPGDEPAREAYVRHAIELVGCFIMRCTDHLPQVADLGNKLFGGSASGQVITLGGVTPSGENGVNDMTYLCLKVTEMLGLKDPNMNARYADGVNSRAYLRRLCEVNYLTGATPSIHNDRPIIEVLEEQGFSTEEARDWSATGCVEPTSCGRHYGHTNCMMFNLVAPLEMALRDGYHPLIEDTIGPRTGDPRSYTSFAQVQDAYFAQLRRMIELATEANNILGEAHQVVRPTPFLSNLIEGPLQSGKDLSEGGARHNSSGTGNVGLVDVVDSLVAIKTLVFDEQRVDINTLLAALDADFVGHEKLLARIENHVPKFGSGHVTPKAIADEVVRFCHETFRAQPHYRGGHYNSGFWSMSNHVAFGLLSGALPSGRRRGKPFTPGITPAPSRRASIVDHIHDVAALDHRHIPNNIAFNVKVAPAPGEGQDASVGHMTGYTQAYVEENGMQLQFNVVSSQTLRDAMAHPEQYRTLLVRISGYNAYFNDLNDDMKRELIARAEHRL